MAFVADYYNYKVTCGTRAIEVRMVSEILAEMSFVGRVKLPDDSHKYAVGCPFQNHKSTRDQRPVNQKLGIKAREAVGHGCRARSGET